MHLASDSALAFEPETRFSMSNKMANADTKQKKTVSKDQQAFLEDRSKSFLVKKGKNK